MRCIIPMELEIRMEPQDKKRLALQKAINAHEEAEAALTDLIARAPGPRYADMLARIRQIMTELRSDAASAARDDLA